MNIKRRFSRGFTLIELMVVIIIVGLLSSIAVISFNDVQAKVRDTSVLSDLDAMEAAQANYAAANNVAGLAYYSSSGYSSVLDFSPSEGNVIDVALNDTDYCIRGYNTGSNKKSIYNSFTKESSPGVCSGTQTNSADTGIILPSAAAIAASPSFSGNLKWLQVSANYSFSCGVASNFKAYCWGLNENGQLGDGNGGSAGQYSISPVAVSTAGVLSGKLIKSVVTGGANACAIASDSQVYCWGRGKNGQLGNGSGDGVIDSYSNVPVAVGGVVCAGALCGKTVKSLSGGGYNYCAIASDNQAYCWGANWDGELGNNISSSYNNTPTAVYTSGVLSGKTIKSIASGKYHSCVIASDSNAYCWGMAGDSTDSRSGGLGDGVLTNYTDRTKVPVAVNKSGALNGKTIKSIAAGYHSTCVIASDNNAYCWGMNAYGLLGDGTTNDSWLAVAVGGSTCAGVLCGKSLKSISMSSQATHVCAINFEDKAYCWGRNDYGADGIGNYNTTQSLPKAVDTSGVLSGKKIRTITVGGGNSAISSYDFTVAIDTEGNAYSWGCNNPYGQLGIGVEPATTQKVNVPNSLVTVTL